MYNKFLFKTTSTASGQQMMIIFVVLGKNSIEVKVALPIVVGLLFAVMFHN